MGKQVISSQKVAQQNGEKTRFVKQKNTGCKKFVFLTEKD
jgi:hypothetical protein